MSKKILTIVLIIVLVRLESINLTKEKIDCVTDQITLCTEKITITRDRDQKELYDFIGYLQNIQDLVNIMKKTKFKGEDPNSKNEYKFQTTYNMDSQRITKINADRLFIDTLEIDIIGSLLLKKPSGCATCFNVARKKFFFTDSTVTLEDVQELFNDGVVEQIDLESSLLI